MMHLFILSLFFSSVLSNEVIYDGRAKPYFDTDILDGNSGPYLTITGSKRPSQYIQFVHGVPSPTPLWSDPSGNTEDAIAMSIDNTSIVLTAIVPIIRLSGFRMTQLVAKNHTVAELTAVSQVNTTAFHFSIAADDSKPLNFTHEYQVAHIDPVGGSHVFSVQLGSPFENPTGDLPAAGAHNFKILDHDLNAVFATPFISKTWHNFAVVVDWDELTLAVYYSAEDQPLKLVSPTKKNQGAQAGPNGQGEFEFGVLKLPLVNPLDPPEHRNDVAHYGFQEGTNEGLYFSGVFIEKVTEGSGPALSGPI